MDGQEPAETGNWEDEEDPSLSSGPPHDEPARKADPKTQTSRAGQVARRKFLRTLWSDLDMPQANFSGFPKSSDFPRAPPYLHYNRRVTRGALCEKTQQVQTKRRVDVGNTGRTARTYETGQPEISRKSKAAFTLKHLL